MDKIDRHVNKYTLDFSIPEYEHQWRLVEISHRIYLLYASLFYIVAIDILYCWMADTIWRVRYI